METQVQSPWRKEPNLRWFGIITFIFLSFVNLLLFLLAGPFWKVNLEKLILLPNEFLGLDLDNKYLDLFHSDFARLILFLFVLLIALISINFIINLINIFVSYFNLAKLFSIIGYMVFGLTLFVYYSGGIADVTFFTFDIANLYQEKPFLNTYTYPFLISLVFTISVLFDRYSLKLLSTTILKWHGLEALIIYIFTTMLIFCIRGLGYLAGLIYFLAWNISLCLNQGLPAIQYPIVVIISLLSVHVSAIFNLGCIFLILPWVPHLSPKPWKLNCYKLGLELFIPSFIILLPVFSFYYFQYSPFSGGLPKVASLEYLGNNYKTVILLNYKYKNENEPSIRYYSANFNSLIPFDETIIPQDWNIPYPKYSITEANINKIEKYLDATNGKGPFGRSAKVALGCGYFCLLQPEKGAQWFHQASLCPGGAFLRNFDFKRLSGTPIRSPYIDYIHEYSDESKWIIGSNLRDEFIKIKQRYNLHDQNKAGQINGSLIILSNHPSSLRIGLIINADQNDAFSYSEHYWVEGRAKYNLIEATEIEQSGEFHFDNLGQGDYTLLLLADPNAIPADSWLVNIDKAPGSIEITKDNLDVYLRPIIIEVSDMPIFDKINDLDILKEFGEGPHRKKG